VGGEFPLEEVLLVGVGVTFGGIPCSLLKKIDFKSVLWNVWIINRNEKRLNKN